ncbi:hypothetical protein, partial [Segatella maculosa]|uniref:hypothetical protein n=1 Tax=Segatella maculosa TaxID=439703 RepID=UPI0023F449C7
PANYLIIWLILKFNVQNSKFKAKVPTCSRMERRFGSIDNQLLTPCVAILAILPFNMGHIAR